MASDDAKKCTYFERHGCASEETDALDKSADQGCGAPHHALVRCPDRGADHRHTGDGASARREAPPDGGPAGATGSPKRQWEIAPMNPPAELSREHATVLVRQAGLS